MNRKLSRLFSYIFDLIAFLILLIFTLLDLYLFKKQIGDAEAYDSKFPKVSAIVVTLVPCIITIVSISLSISKDKIYGVTINEITELRGRFYFTFFHMIIITCVIIGTYSLLSALNARVGIYCLELISLIYSIAFSIQEVPILVHSKWAIKRILNKNYLLISRHDLLFEKESSKIFNTIITNVILTEGIDTAFNLLDKKGRNAKDLLDYLLTMQNTFFWNVLDNISIDKSSPTDLYMDVSIGDAIDTGYENITKFISNYSGTDIATKIETKKYYQITRSLFSLHELCSSLGLQKKENKEMISMISGSSIFTFLGQKNLFGISPIICMAATTLNDGKTWFVRFLRDNSFYPSAIFDFEKCPIGIFTSMMINHLIAKKVLSKEEENELLSFIDEPVQGLNADGSSWKKLMARAIEFGKNESVVESLGALLRYYNSVDEVIFYFHGTRKRAVYDGDEEFTKQDIFHDWLLLVFASYYKGFSKIEFKKVLNQLNEDESRLLSEELSEKWFDEGKLKRNIDTTFLKFFDIDLPFTFYESDLALELINQLVEFHDNFYQKEFNNHINSAVTSLQESKNFIIEKFNETISQNPFYDSQLSTISETEKCFRFTIRAHDYEKILKFYLGQLPYSFKLMINKRLENEFGTEQVYGKNINDEIAKEVIDFEPEFTTSAYLLKSYLLNKTNKYIDQIKSLDVEDVQGFYPGIYGKKGGIRFNAVIDKNLTIIRPLSNDELEEIVENEYKPFDNGLYRYSEIENDKKRDFYVTKSQLIEYLSKSIFYVCIVFKSSILVDRKLVKTFFKKDS